MIHTYTVVINGTNASSFSRKFQKTLHRLCPGKYDEIVVRPCAANPDVTIILTDPPIHNSGRLIVWEDLLKEEVPGQIRCGFSPKNDLTFSSLEKNKLVICLQNAILSMHGDRIEPQEVCVRGCVGDAYPILAAAAVRFLISAELDS